MYYGSSTPRRQRVRCCICGWCPWCCWLGYSILLIGCRLRVSVQLCSALGRWLQHSGGTVTDAGIVCAHARQRPLGLVWCSTTSSEPSNAVGWTMVLWALLAHMHLVNNPAQSLATCKNDTDSRFNVVRTSLWHLTLLLRMRQQTCGAGPPMQRRHAKLQSDL